MSTTPENFREIGSKTFEKTPFKHASRKFVLTEARFFVEIDVLWIFVLTKAFPENHYIGKGESVVHVQKK